MNPPTDWTTPLVILAAGVILGAMFIFAFMNRRKSAATIQVDPERKDLEAKRDALVAELRALPDDAVDERARLERETASVLRQLDARGVQPSGLPPGGAQAAAMSPFAKGFLSGAGSVAALAALLFFVYKTATPRNEGQEATGGIGSPQQQQQQQAASDPVVQQMEAAVQKDPNNNELRLGLAQAYLERDNLMGVFEQTKVVLDRDPQNPRALTFGALVRMAMGEVDTATQMLQTATKVDSKNLDSWVALAWVYAQTNRMSDAEGAIAQAIKASPENKGRLEQVLGQMKQQVAQAGQQQQQPAAAAGALPADHPPVTPAPAAGGRAVKVTLNLDASARSRQGILFVIARPLAGGPPVAVKRIQASSFPLTVDLSAADSMMGQPLPDKFRLEARLDSDGDAATKPPTDPSAMQAEVNVGASVVLALK
jgi:cytochrome c-type biogenesis protein CcmH